MTRTMIKLLSMLILVGLTGCAHGGISSWSGNKFTACCDRILGGCSETNWKKITLQACPSGDSAVEGAFTSSQVTGMSYGGGQAHFNRSNQSCRLYRCNVSFGMVE